MCIAKSDTATTDGVFPLLDFCVDADNFVDIISTASIPAIDGAYASAIELLINDTVVFKDSKTTVPADGEDVSFVIFYKDVAIDFGGSGVSNYKLNIIYQSEVNDGSCLLVQEKSASVGYRVYAPGFPVDNTIVDFSAAAGGDW